MKKMLICCLLLLSSSVIAQYSCDLLKNREDNISGFCKKPNAKDIALFEKAPVVFIKAEVPQNAKKLPFEKSTYYLPLKESQQFAIRYNKALESLMKKYYPYDVDYKVLTLKEFKELKRKSKEVYAYVKPMNHSLLFFGLSNKKFSMYGLPIAEEMYKNTSNMEAELQFMFHRLENFFIRMKKGSCFSGSVAELCAQERTNRLKRDYAQKTLVINKKDTRVFSTEDIDKLLDIDFIVVEQEEFDKIIIEKNPKYWYLKIMVYEEYYKSESQSGNIVYKTNSKSTQGVHYIIDPIDGTAMFEATGFEPYITPPMLKRYNEALQLEKY